MKMAKLIDIDTEQEYMYVHIYLVEPAWPSYACNMHFRWASYHIPLPEG